jgi:type II secretory pathway component PulK
MIMNEVRSFLQVFRQGTEVQRLTEDVEKLRAAWMVQGTVHIGQVSLRDRVRRLNILRQIVRQGWRVVIRLLVWDKRIVRYMLTKVRQATHHLVCIRKAHTLDVHCLLARIVKLLSVCPTNF